MKKLFGIVAGVAVSAALMTGCGGNNNTAETKENTAETAAASAENADGDLKIAIVTSPSGVDDGSFNQDNYNGILKFIESHPGATVTPVREETGDPAAVIQAVADIVANGGNILFVGTKKQAQDAIKTEAERCGMFYVNERWLGGMLTNFRTIQSRIARLKEIETMATDGTFEVLPKKEVIALKKEWEKLEKNLGGIKEMKKIPDAIFVVDPKKERICIQEAHTLGIKLIGIADTNCDPEELDYVIPGNDDAIRAVKLIVSKMADAVIEANQGAEMTAEEAESVAADEAVEEA